MADSLLMTASGALPEELFKYFVDGIHLLKGVLLAAAAHMVAWVVIGRDIKLHLRTVAQRDIGIHLLHEDSPDRQRHSGTLPHTHGIEVDIAILTAYPAATYQLRSKGDKPSITVVIGGTRLGTYLSLQLITVAQSSCRTIIHNAHHHGEHLHGIVGTDHLIHSWLEGGDGVTLVILDAAHEHRSRTDTMVGKGCIALTISLTLTSHGPRHKLRDA